MLSKEEKQDIRSGAKHVRQLAKQSYPHSTPAELVEYVIESFFCSNVFETITDRSPTQPEVEEVTKLIISVLSD